MSSRRPPIIHAGAKGYPLCGAKLRPSTRDGKVWSDVVSGGGPWGCPACLAMVVRAAPAPTEAA